MINSSKLQRVEGKDFNLISALLLPYSFTLRLIGEFTSSSPWP